MKSIKLELKENFETVEEGTHYRVPQYKIVDGKGIVEIETMLDIKFVRGSKLKDEEVEKREGTLPEHLLSVMITDMKFKNSLVPCSESSQAITSMQNALNWMRQRQVDRIQRQVQGTYKK